MQKKLNHKKKIPLKIFQQKKEFKLDKNPQKKFGFGKFSFEKIHRSQKKHRKNSLEKSFLTY